MDEKSPKVNEKGLKREFESYYRQYSSTKDTTCGYSVLRGSFLQFFARKNSFVLVNGLAGSLVNASFACFNASLSTIEKLYGIPSRKSGLLSVGNEISQVVVLLFITYHLGNKHRPRWMAVGLSCVSLFCFIAVLPHLIYGSGKDTLQLTREYGHLVNISSESSLTDDIEKTMCRPGRHLEEISSEDCENPQNFMPQIILFVGQITAGVGNAIYSSLNAAYLDDNVPKSKAPWVTSILHIIKLFGPACGFALASICLKVFVETTSTPMISSGDPRWIGAWWLGMIVLGVLSAVFAFLISLFPKRMPRYVAKLEFAEKNSARELMVPEKKKEKSGSRTTEEEEERNNRREGWREITRRILKNKIFVLHVASMVVFFYANLPYWIFLTKYSEVQYRFSASEGVLYTGIIGLIFSILGVLTSGFVLSKWKPDAKRIILWNIFTAAFSAAVMFSYNWLGCDATDLATKLTTQQLFQEGELNSCNSLCNCDIVKYTPVCGEDGVTYISPCHAGCADNLLAEEVFRVHRYSNCSCVGVDNREFPLFGGGSAVPGACKVNCWNWNSLYPFMILMCLMNFVSCTSIAGNFLIGVRSLNPRDKTFGLGVKMAACSLFAFIPSPIMFGALMDSSCIYWGKTSCGRKANCWIYDAKRFRFQINIISSLLLLITIVLKARVWCCVKEMSIFDDNVEELSQVDSNSGNSEELKGENGDSKCNSIDKKLIK